MDSFQELFSGGDTWSNCERRDATRITEGGGSTSSVDSTSPQPLHHHPHQQVQQSVDLDDKDEKKNANSIRGWHLHV
ncbi:hypothetical protein QE152_g1886 [Popillia japonica]|uniref:Uncharacterized protein n=1 Tax=Popillia japonica TaxID=7064 RepID=A0AAW1N7A9_POPJA